MKKITFVISLLLMVHLGKAQITFQKTYGGTGDNQGYCVKQTADGGYIIAGKSNSLGMGYTDFFIVKTNATGDTLWTKSMGSIGVDKITSVEQTVDGGYIFAGVYAPPPSYSYAFLMKTDGNGNILWTKAYGNSFSQDAKCVQQTSDGGYIICGNVVIGSSSNDYLLLKTNAFGVVSWSKAYGSNSSDFAYYVEQTSDGGFVFTGHSAASIELIKTDISGNLLWSKNYGNGIGNCVHQTNDGGYAVLGNSSGAGFGSDDITLKKTDINGNLIWENRYGGVSSEKGHSFSQTADGGYIISGTTSALGSSKLLMIKTDSAGNVSWSKIYGSSGFSEAGFVNKTADGGYIVLGKYGNATDNYFYLVKTDDNGTSGCNQTDTTLSFLTNISVPVMPGTSAASFFINNVVPLVNVISTPPAVLANSPCIFNEVLELSVNQIDFMVTPNPSRGVFTITFNKKLVAGNISILNGIGKPIYSHNFFNKSTISVALTNSVPGIYFLIVDDGEKRFTEKIVIGGY